MAFGPEVMLASPTSSEIPADLIARLQREGWLFELKFDGIRAVVSRDEAGVIRIHNRRQADITFRYPDVIEQMDGDWVGVIDGEIIVAGPDGRPDFASAHTRDAQRTRRGVASVMRSAPATFVPFDVLEENGFDLRLFTYSERRARLEELLPEGVAVSLSNPDGATMWSFVQANNLEGLVAKRPDGRYRGGRGKSWLKIKSTHRISALVCGITPGKGSREAQFGALRLCLWDPVAKELVPIGHVGGGLSEAAVRDVSERLGRREPIVVEVEYLEVSPAGRLRMPIFRGVRSDIAPDACTTATLPVRPTPRTAAG